MKLTIDWPIVLLTIPFVVVGGLLISHYSNFGTFIGVLILCIGTGIRRIE